MSARLQRNMQMLFGKSLLSQDAPPQPTVVLKIGGSVFRGLSAYPIAARYVRDRLMEESQIRWLIVVSAQHGQTDRLEQLARGLHGKPHPRVLDVLWSTGELRSVALLSLAMMELGLDVRALNIHQSGLLRSGSVSNTIDVDHRRLSRAWSGSRVAVVPGFFARNEIECVESLGRGGSDLTAVLLAIASKAVRCEFIKDVAGYHDRDPKRHADAKPLARLSYEEALRFADHGCRVLQREAILVAAGARLPMIVRSLEHTGTCTWIGDDTPEAQVASTTSACGIVDARVSRLPGTQPNKRGDIRQ